MFVPPSRRLGHRELIVLIGLLIAINPGIVILS